MRVCISGGEYVWQLILAFVIAWLGVVVFVAGHRGTIRFAPLIKLKDHQRFAIVLACFLWGVALLVIAATVMGGGC